MKSVIKYSSIFIILCQNIAFGQDFVFYQNKGQWHDEVLYASTFESGDVYVAKGGIVYDFFSAKWYKKQGHSHTGNGKIGDSIIHKHAVKVEFIGGDFSNALIKANRPTKDVNHYFLGKQPQKWASNVRGYNQLTIKNLYDGIDLTYYTNKKGELKYDINVAKNGDVQPIKWRYKGANVKLKNGRIICKTSVNTMAEHLPIAYQIYRGEKRKIACEFVEENGVFSYRFPNGYDKKMPLIIDPVVIFASYSGSRSDNFGYTATYDDAGNLYVAGTAFGSNYPTTVGAYDRSFNSGGLDVVISKFNSTGSRLVYSTYLGGNQGELPHSMVVDKQGRLFVFGTTGSSNFPTTASAYDTSFNGGSNLSVRGLGIRFTNGSDMFVACLDSTGGRLEASTYIGGSANDGINHITAVSSNNHLRYNYADEVRGEIQIDSVGNVYVASCTRSDDFPTTSGAYQSRFGGVLDGVVFVMDQQLRSLISSSYFGGSEADGIYALDRTKNNDIVVAGGTRSSSLSFSSGYQSAYQTGRCDGFVAVFSNDVSRLISGTYYGTDAYDQIYNVKLDKKENIYVFGQTEKTGNFYKHNMRWGEDGRSQFVSKFSSDLSSRIWSTSFGSSGRINISPSAFMVDYCDNIYLSGWGGGTNNVGGLHNQTTSMGSLPTSSDAYQSASDGSDFYVMVLNQANQTLKYGSFFGGGTSQEHVDGGTSRFDKKGVIYQAVCAGCRGNSDFPTTSGVWSRTNGSSNCNIGVFKIDLETQMVVANFSAPPQQCVGQAISFANYSRTSASAIYSWDFGDGTSSSLENPTHTYSVSGTHRICLIVSDTTACNRADTSCQNIHILGNSSQIRDSIYTCLGERKRIGTSQSTSGLSVNWSPNINISDTRILQPTVSPNVSRQYRRIISNGSCADTSFYPVQVVDLNLAIPSDTVICSSDSLELKANSSGSANEFQWSLNRDFSTRLNLNNRDSVIKVLPTRTVKYYIKIKTQHCEKTDSLNVVPFQNQISIAKDTIFVCYNDERMVRLVNHFPANPSTHRWYPNRDIIRNFDDSVLLKPFSNGYLYVESRNSRGCFSKDSVYLSVDSLSLKTIRATATPPRIFQTQQSTLKAFPIGYNYRWTSLSSNENPIVVSPNKTTRYPVEIKGTACVKNAEVTVEVEDLNCDETEVFVPTMFTPNGDGHNDKLFVRGVQIDKIQWRIYNRWGEKVFSSHDKNIGWNGLYKQSKSPQGVYVYHLKVWCKNGYSFLKKGNVTLVR